MKHYILSALLLAGLASCKDGDNRQQLIKIAGHWYNVNRMSGTYLKLNFTAKEAVFDCLVDTLLRFHYTIDQQTHILWLTDATGKRQGTTILKATSDSLVFAQLWGVESAQRFIKR